MGFADPPSPTGEQRFTSAGGENEWETFTLSEPADIDSSFELIAVTGPRFANVPDYPALRVIDFQVVGERFDNSPGYFNVRLYESTLSIAANLAWPSLHACVVRSSGCL